MWSVLGRGGGKLAREKGERGGVGAGRGEVYKKLKKLKFFSFRNGRAWRLCGSLINALLTVTHTDPQLHTQTHTAPAFCFSHFLQSQELKQQGAGRDPLSRGRGGGGWGIPSARRRGDSSERVHLTGEERLLMTRVSHHLRNYVLVVKESLHRRYRDLLERWGLCLICR